MATSKGSGNLDRHLRMVLAGEITFDACARATRLDWERMAAHLARRWAPPAWYAPNEDIVQELLVAAWTWLWSWDSARGPTLARYVVWNAMGAAKRRLHKARGAQLHGSGDRNPSRIERPFSSMSREGVDDSEADARFIEGLLRVEPEAERAMIDREDRRIAAMPAMRRCRTARDRAALSAIADAGGLDSGADALYADKGMRAAFGLARRADAQVMVEEVAAMLAVPLDA